MSRKDNLLHSGFLNSAYRFPDRPAVWINGRSITYKCLKEKACAISGILVEHDHDNEALLTAVFAYRSETAFSGILAALLRGHGYVPLNRTFPLDRTLTMLDRSECRAVIVDADSEPQLEHLLSACKNRMLVILPEADDVRHLERRHPRHRFVGSADLTNAEVSDQSSIDPDNIAYLLFTSGSTGIPKGVMVTHNNVRSFIEFAIERYRITEHDRLSQTFDMTFDLSVFDLFIAWEKGACVCCPSQKETIKPDKFINDSGVTVWFSVPSTGIFLKRLGALKKGRFPGLRLSLFCGEALPVEVAKSWSEAAPNSVVENIYGPTELTIACTYYRWEPTLSPEDCEQGIVPIGSPFPAMEALVVDTELNEVDPGKEGELMMTGPQMTPGYWHDPEKTATAFIVPPGKDKTYYRTGDRVRRPFEGKPLVYLGRMDSQIKIQGHRVELGEVESVVRELSGVDGVVALGWPITLSGADAIEVFLETDKVELKDLRNQISRRLPTYMVPRNYHTLARFPLNSNGKFDRKALLKMLEGNT